MSGFVELSVDYLHHTSGAVLVDDGGEECWIPLSQIQDEHDFDTYDRHTPIAIMVSEWFAEEEGLV